MTNVLAVTRMLFVWRRVLDDSLFLRGYNLSRISSSIQKQNKNAALGENQLCVSVEYSKTK